jgi:hypothetical protein
MRPKLCIRERFPDLKASWWRYSSRTALTKLGCRVERNNASFAIHQLMRLGLEKNQGEEKRRPTIFGVLGDSR